MIKCIRKHYNKKLEKYCKNNYARISHDRIGYRYNYMNQRCHWNSFAVYDENTEKFEIIKVIAIDNDYVHCHFIAYDKEADLYVDDTYGPTAQCYDMYVVGKVDVDNLPINMDEELLDLKRESLNNITHKFNPIRKYYKDIH